MASTRAQRSIAHPKGSATVDAGFLGQHRLAGLCMLTSRCDGPRKELIPRLSGGVGGSLVGKRSGRRFYSYLIMDSGRRRALRSCRCLRFCGCFFGRWGPSSRGRCRCFCCEETFQTFLSLVNAIRLLLSSLGWSRCRKARSRALEVVCFDRIGIG